MVGVDQPGEVAQRGEPAGADGGADDPIAQRAAHGVGNDDREPSARGLLELAPQPRCGRVRVARQEHDTVGAGGVGAVHPCAGADETMVGLGDEQRAAMAHDADALAQDHLDDTGIAVGGGELEGTRARFHRGEVDDLPLRLAHRLVRHHHDVAVAQIGEADRRRPARSSPAAISASKWTGKIWTGVGGTFGCIERL